MKREELEALGMTKEQIDKVLDTHHAELDPVQKDLEITQADLTAEKTKTATQETTIKDLKKDNADNEELQTKVKNYETEIENLKNAATNTAREYALKDRLKEAGVTDADYVIYKQGGLEKFTFDNEGKPVGVDELLKPLRESSPHLFKEAFSGGDNPAGGTGGQPKNPFAKETFNLTEQGRLLRDNPAQARQLAAAAGVKI